MSYRAFFLICLVLLTAAGCSSVKEPVWEPDKKPKIFSVATRQLPPEPTYNALRWVRPPQVLPARKIESSDGTLIMPIMQFEVSDRPLGEVALILAAGAGYRSYCAGTIADRRLTLLSLGTIDELGREIEKQAGIDVVIDHRIKEVKFLAKSGNTPQFEKN